MGCRFESCRRSIRPCCLVLGRARFLSDEEIRVLSRRLSAHAEAAPGQVAVVRLLLLTGCRKSEIPHTALVRLPRRASPSSRTPSRVPAPSGCRHRLASFSTDWTGAVSGCSRQRGARARGKGTGSNGSGARFAPKPDCTAFAFTICAIPMPISRSGTARPCSPSPGCSATAIRPPRCAARISPTGR